MPNIPKRNTKHKIINQAFIDHLPESSDIKNSPYNSDSFKTTHDGRHILFAGCSMTWGEGVGKEESWAYKTYNKIAETEKVSGYFNIAVIGFSVTEIIANIYRYINDYGKPDTIFLFLPDPGRDFKYVMDLDAHSPNPNRAETLRGLIYNLYYMLDTYCRSTNTQLIASSWVTNIVGRSQDLFPGAEQKLYYPGSKVERPHWMKQLVNRDVEDMFTNSVDPLLTKFNSYYKIDPKTMELEVFKYDSQKRGEAKKLSLIGSDEGAHPGTSFHDYWADFMFNCYKMLDNPGL